MLVILKIILLLFYKLLFYHSINLSVSSKKIKLKKRLWIMIVGALNKKLDRSGSGNQPWGGRRCMSGSEPEAGHYTAGNTCLS